MSLTDTILANTSRIRRRIGEAAARSGREAASIRVVAVTKTFPATYVRAVFGAGLDDIGENRVQEAVDKIETTTDLAVTWHLIGHLQSNKAGRAASSFAWIHSVDSVGLLRRLDRLAAEASTSPRLLTQVHLGNEPTKHGASVDDLRGIFETAGECRHARMRGLMIIPPPTDDAEGARPFFRRLRELRDELINEGIEPTMLVELSMGMSHDFEVAVEEGASMVRIGTALFGPRPQV